MDNQEWQFVSMRFPKDIVDKIDKLAASNMRSRTAEVIVLLRKALQEQDD
jgi:metal-responsive CopG/Arc/MetJ family transcriptional regulator